MRQRQWPPRRKTMPDNAVFDHVLDNDDLVAVVCEWLLSKHGLRLTRARLRVTRDGIEMDTASVKASACCKCYPELFMAIRRNMDSKSGNRFCDGCGKEQRHAFFLQGKSESITG